VINAGEAISKLREKLLLPNIIKAYFELYSNQ
jgi:hypothetical protein